MSKHDIHNGLLARVALNTAAITSNTTTNGTNIIDTQGYSGLEFLMTVGARTDGTFSMTIQHGDASDLSDATTVDASDLLGTTAQTAANTAQTQKRIGYVGNKRYVRANVVSTSVTSGATVGVAALLGRPTVGPTPAN